MDDKYHIICINIEISWQGSICYIKMFRVVDSCRVQSGYIRNISQQDGLQKVPSSSWPATGVSLKRLEGFGTQPVM